MIEIVCPSCEAKYQLPEGSIGPDGRNVSCASCSHKWRAYAEELQEAVAAPADTVADMAAGPSKSASAGETREGPSVAESMAAIAAADTASAPDSPAPPPATGGREEQMAAIRQMLSELKESADAAPESEPEAAPPVEEAPRHTMRVRDEEDDYDKRDPLKSRIDDLEKTGRIIKGQPTPTSYDHAKLRKKHDRRAKKFQRSRERRKRSGGFLTGFTLVGVVAATMVALYVMHPKIIAAQPQMAPAMNEYVATIDRYRLQFNEKTTEWRTWLVERISGLTEGEG